MHYERPAMLFAVFLVGVAIWRAVALWQATVHGARFDRLEPAECWFEVPAGRVAHCGYLRVPDHRERGITTYSRLAIAVFSPPGGARERDPVLFLAGGPGGAFGFAEGKAWWWNWIDTVALTHGREFIAMDQRGVGRSEPRVDCPGLRVLEGRLLQREVLPDEEDAQWIAAVQSCRERLLGRGVDFGIYGSAQSAADIEELRRALGFDQWNLYGISYGTRLALATARDHPDGVRSLVLDSVYPPGVQTLVEGPAGLDRALKRAWTACTSCDGTDAALARVLPALNRRPVRVRFTHPTSLESFEVVLDGDRLIDALIVGLSGHADVRKLADAVEGLDRGDTRAAAELVRESWMAMQDEDFSYPVNFSVECREDVPFNDMSQAIARAESFPLIARHERRDAEVMRRICDFWGVLPEPRENEPVQSDIPTLILAGLFDPVTPVAWAEQAARFLPHAQLLTFLAGHSVTDADPCALKLIAAFLADPHQPPSADCYPRAELPAVQRP